MTNQSNQKFYTFINMKNCVGNANYTGITLEASVIKPEGLKKTSCGKNVFNFITPISNRGRYIASKCGVDPKEDKNGIIWARVSVWDQKEDGGTATRLSNFIAKNEGKKIKLIITGSIKVEESGDYVNTNITCDDFCVMKVSEKSASTENSNSNTEDSGNGCNEIDGFSSIDDEDLPF